MKGVEKLKKDSSGDKPIYTYEDVLFRGLCGLLREGSKGTMWLYGLQVHIERDLGANLMYRCVRGDQLEQVMKTGTDIPGLKKGDNIFATSYLEKSTEYGTPDLMDGQPLDRDLCVILYEKSGLKDKFNSYECIFLEDPKEILMGALIFRNIGKRDSSEQ